MESRVRENCMHGSEGGAGIPSLPLSVDFVSWRTVVDALCKLSLARSGCSDLSPPVLREGDPLSDTWAKPARSAGDIDELSGRIGHLSRRIIELSGQLDDFSRGIGDLTGKFGESSGGINDFPGRPAGRAGEIGYSSIPIQLGNGREWQ
uniref:Uncharacterized protein n=1 Tax=Candidatus Kentrum sp. SD TaxID=2126332 RepID=A0A450Z121_9GAMM|nr:MAG: hypothetical protein BECKSD772F_GA0070984_109412 [Candidatus Kentron sp. SD]VFK47480.1 MAG: hypothetical protein BECKSD772E_GA0070983_109512 [Candidatus Kentron sp. SD]VFK79044.1 MAG: hypothetical protein BECKSD772D_GA0070982_10341 [Candidatus Kentron sp. SD]